MAPAKPKFDPYAVLELSRDCTEKEIQKAYKEQCRKWHPDKNLDRIEEANRRFLLAKDAFDLLFDKAIRADYDRERDAVRVRDAKQRERMERAEGDRKRFMEDLERREKAFAEGFSSTPEGQRVRTEREKKRDEHAARESFEEMRRRLEREVNEEIRAQNERVRAVRDEVAERPKPQLRVSWRRGDYDEARLRRIFGEYGRIHLVTGILAKKGGSGSKMCVIEYEAGEKPWGAELETGKEGDKLKAAWLQEPEKDERKGKREGEGKRAEGEEEQEEERVEGKEAVEDLSGLSFEELEARLLGGIDVAPPTKKPRDGPSWKEEI